MRTGGIEVPITVDDQIEAGVAKAEGTLEAAVARMEAMDATVEIKGDVDQLNRSIALAEAKLDELSTKRAEAKVGVDVDDGEIDALKGKIDAMKARRNVVTVILRQKVEGYKEIERAVTKQQNLDYAQQRNAATVAKLRQEYNKLAGDVLKSQKNLDRLRRSTEGDKLAHEALVHKMHATGAQITHLGGRFDDITKDIEDNDSWLTRWGKTMASTRVRIGPMSTTLRGLAYGMTGLAPIILDLIGSASALVGVVGTSLTGAFSVATAGLGGFALSALGVGLVLKPMFHQLGVARKASIAYSDAVQKYGKNSSQAADKLDQMNHALKGTSPEMGKAIKNFSEMRAKWQGMTGDLKKPFFDTVAEGLKTATALMPDFARQTGKTFRTAAHETQGWLQALRGPEAKGIMNDLMGNFRKGLPALMDGFGSLATILGRVGQSASKFLPSLNKGFANWSQNLADSIGKGATLDTKMGRLVGHMQDFGHFTQASGRLLVTFFGTGADAGDNLLQSMTKAENKWTDWMKSAEGQKSLKHFFDASVDGAKNLFNILAPLGSLFVQFGTAARPIVHGMELAAVYAGKIVTALQRAIPFGTQLMTALGVGLGAKRIGGMIGLNAAISSLTPTLKRNQAPIRANSSALRTLGRDAEVAAASLAGGAVGGGAAGGAAGAAATGGSVARNGALSARALGMMETAVEKGGAALRGLGTAAAESGAGLAGAGVAAAALIDHLAGGQSREAMDFQERMMFNGRTIAEITRQQEVAQRRANVEAVGLTRSVQGMQDPLLNVRDATRQANQALGLMTTKQLKNARSSINGLRKDIPKLTQNVGSFVLSAAMKNPFIPIRSTVQQLRSYISDMAKHGIPELQHSLVPLTTQFSHIKLPSIKPPKTPTIKGPKVTPAQVAPIKTPKLGPVRLRIVGDDGHFRAVVRRDQAVKIPPKRAQIKGDAGNSIGLFGAVKAAMAAIPGSKRPKVHADTGNSVGLLGAVQNAINAIQSKTVTITTNHVNKFSGGGGGGSYAMGGPTTAALNRAADRAALRATKSSDGGAVVRRPTFLAGEEPGRTEFVITDNPAYRLSNTGYLADAADALGYAIIPAYKGGKGGGKGGGSDKAKARRQAKRERNKHSGDNPGDAESSEWLYWTDYIDEWAGEYELDRRAYDNNLTTGGLYGGFTLNDLWGDLQNEIWGYQNLLRIGPETINSKKELDDVDIPTGLKGKKGKRLKKQLQKAQERVDAHNKLVSDAQGDAGDLTPRKINQIIQGLKLDQLELAQAANQNEILGTTSFNAARYDLLRSFGGNIAPVAGGGIGGRGSSGMLITPPTQPYLSPAAVGSGGGSSPTAFDGSATGSRNVSVTNYFQQPPPDPHTWSQSTLFELQAA